MSLPQVTSNPLPQRKPKRAAKGQDVASKDNPPSDGIYSNKLMVHSVMLLTGHQVDVELIDSSIWTGILRTVSPEMAIVLSVAHLKKNTKNKPCLLASHDAIRTHLVIPFGEVVTISATQVETPHTDNFKTDIEISTLNGMSDRDLKPFTDFEDVTDNIPAMNETGGGGWSVEEMISTNENRFNVKSTYTDDLQGYTTQLEQSDTPEYLLRKRRAEQLAQQIEDRDRHYNEGEDRATTEEDKYSSVVRPNAIATLSPTPQSPSPTSQRQQDSGFVEQLGDVSSEPLVVTNTQSTIEPNKTDHQEPEPLDSSRDDVLEDLKVFSQNFQLVDSSNRVTKESSQPQVDDVSSTVVEETLKSSKLNPLAEEFNPTAVVKTPTSPTTNSNNNTYNSNMGGRRNSRGGRGYNQYFQQHQQHSMLSTLPDYMAAQQTYMASAFPVSQVMPFYQTLSQQQQQQQQVTSPRQQQQRLLLSPQVFSNPYYDGVSQMIAMPHPQQAAMMSQLSSNRQTIPPTQPVYIIPQPQVTTGMPPAPSVAAATFQPTQFATLGSPQLSAQYMPSTYQM